jgi:hypothetical protein
MNQITFRNKWTFIRAGSGSPYPKGNHCSALLGDSSRVRQSIRNLSTGQRTKLQRYSGFPLLLYRHWSGISPTHISESWVRFSVIQGRTWKSPNCVQLRARDFDTAKERQQVTSGYRESHNEGLYNLNTSQNTDQEGYGLDGQGTGVRLPARFPFISTKSRPAVMPIPGSYTICIGANTQDQSGGDVKLTTQLLSSAEVRNGGAITPLPNTSS